MEYICVFCSERLPSKMGEPIVYFHKKEFSTIEELNVHAQLIHYITINEVDTGLQYVIKLDKPPITLRN